MICPNRRDDHPEVGPEGVAEAFANQQLYLDRGICSEVHVNEPGPLHPQRFMRKPGITQGQSQALYNDLQNNGCLGPNHYLVISNKQIEDLVVANPQNWPSLASLDQQELLFVQDQLAILWTAHHFTSDFNAKTLRFIRNACGGAVSTPPEPFANAVLRIVPNPASDQFRIEGMEAGPVRIYRLTGQLVLSTDGPLVDTKALTPGVYLVLTENGVGKLVKE
jgi:hypothetical protein